MAALRVSYPGQPVAILDPHTLAPYEPRLSSFVTDGPIVTRQATPAELRASRTPSQRKPRTEINFGRNTRARGLYLAHLTDADITAAVLAGPNLDAAAASLHTSQASLSRRLRQMRAGVAS